MDTLHRIAETLGRAEKDLAALANDAAKESQYDTATAILELARDVNSLTAKARQRLDTSATHASEPRLDAGTDGRRLAKQTVPPSARTRPKKSDYPQFLRHDDTLIKIGWSRRDKSEYEHKSPKRILGVLVAAISKVGTNGKRFTMDRVLPLVDPSDGTKIPEYQVYLCLAWYKALGFLVQHGRQGYSLASRAPIEPLIETHWANLPVR